MKTRFLLIQLLAICLVGCAATTIPGASPDLLGFLVAGRTTRSQVLMTLGQPSARFEGDRILTYRIGYWPDASSRIETLLVDGIMHQAHPHLARCESDGSSGRGKLRGYGGRSRTGRTGPGPVVPWLWNHMATFADQRRTLVATFLAELVNTSLEFSHE